MKNRAFLVLMEQLIMVLVFSVAAAVFLAALAAPVFAASRARF